MSRMRKIPRCLLRLYIFLTFSFVLFVVISPYKTDIILTQLLYWHVKRSVWFDNWCILWLGITGNVCNWLENDYSIVHVFTVYVSVYTVFARVICALFFYFGRWKIGVRKICGFFLWRSWSGFYSSIIENTVLLSIFYCNFVTQSWYINN